MATLNRSADRFMTWAREAEVNGALIVVLITTIGLCIPFVMPRRFEPSGNLTLEAVLIVCLTAPFAEEVLFRGFLQPLLHKLCDLHIDRPAPGQSQPGIAPNFCTSLIFVGCHASGTAHTAIELLGIFFASLALGAMADRGIRLPVLVVIHGSWNMALLFAGAATNQG